MTDGRTAPAPHRIDTLAVRLALGFLGVALAAVALLAGLTAIFAAHDVSGLARHQRSELTRAVAVTAGAAWDRSDSWKGADLMPVLDLAAQTGAEVQIRDQRGAVVAASDGFAARRGETQLSAPVVVEGVHAGQTILRFTGAGLAGADHALVIALLRALAVAAGAAALVALVTAYAIARRLAQPVDHIISVTRARGAGQRTARVGAIRAPSELAELASAFDQAAERLERNEQLRRDLIADVAHELRTPVAILQAGHEALLDGVVEPTPSELASLRDEVVRLGRMVDDLQVLSAADAAALQLDLHRSNLAAIAAVAADSLEGRFEAAGSVLERQLAPAHVRADPRWLHQVVTNLLTNALKFSPAGSGVTIQVRPAGAHAVLDVIDHGMGIPPEDLPHIFDRFWRGRRAAEISGSGIGLAIASELARAHDGTLTATSELGRGTQLTLTLPSALGLGPALGLGGERRGNPGRDLFRAGGRRQATEHRLHRFRRCKLRFRGCRSRSRRCRSRGLPRQNSCRCHRRIPHPTR
jgi:two-component system, OmpR family, sensor histidine kinase BaeS